MNKLKLTFIAAAFGLTGLGAALAADPATGGAAVDAFKPGQAGDEIAMRKGGGDPGLTGDEHGIIAIRKAGGDKELIGLRGQGDEHGIIAIRKAGGDNGLIGLLNQGNNAAGGGTGELLPAVQTGELVPAVKPGELVPAVKPADQETKSTGKLGSLQSLGSVGDLFMHGSGGGAGKPGDVRGLNFANEGPDQHITRTDSFSLNFANNTNAGGTPTGGISGKPGSTVPR